MRHGSLPAPPVDVLLTDDPDVYLATGPLGLDNCRCEALCTCDADLSPTRSAE